VLGTALPVPMLPVPMLLAPVGVLGIAHGGGEAGVTHVLRALRPDFELTMRLSGYARLDELSPDALTRRPAD